MWDVGRGAPVAALPVGLLRAARAAARFPLSGNARPGPARLAQRDRDGLLPLPHLAARARAQGAMLVLTHDLVNLAPELAFAGRVTVRTSRHDVPPLASGVLATARGPG